MGGREAAAGKLNTGRWRGREGGGRRRRRREEESRFQGRIGWKLLQRRRAVPAAPAPRRAAEPSRVTALGGCSEHTGRCSEPNGGCSKLNGGMLRTQWGDAPNARGLPFTQLCHSNDGDVTRCKGKGTQLATARGNPIFC